MSRRLEFEVQLKSHFFHVDVRRPPAPPSLRTSNKSQNDFTSFVMILKTFVVILYIIQIIFYFFLIFE